MDDSELRQIALAHAVDFANRNVGTRDDILATARIFYVFLVGDRPEQPKNSPFVSLAEAAGVPGMDQNRQ